MSLYSIALYLHIVGALGLFVALGLEWTSLFNLRRATTVDQAREWANLSASLRRLYFPSMGTILLSGIYMMATAWGGTGWIAVALVSMFLLAALGAVLTARQMAMATQAVNTETGTLSVTLSQRLRNPLLWASIQTRVGIALGIVFLMAVKPDVGVALLAMVIAAILGFAVSLPAWSRNSETEKVKDVTA